MIWPVNEFYAGSNDLSLEEIELAAIFESRGRTDMASLVRDGRKMQRFLFFNGGGISREQEDFEALFQGLRAAWAGNNNKLSPYQTWKNEALEKYAGDEQLIQLLRKCSARLHDSDCR